MSYNYGPLVLGQSGSSEEGTSGGTTNNSMTTSLVAPDPEDLAQPASAVVRFLRCTLRCLRCVKQNVVLVQYCLESSIHDFYLFLYCTVVDFRVQ